MKLEKHFVTFYSPGTFISEQCCLPIDSWDVDTAIKMSKDIVERHGAKPYCFVFSTRGRDVYDLDSREINKSKTYFLGGNVITLEQIQAKNDPKDEILISNMRSNKWDRVIENNNSWRITVPFKDGDRVV